MVKLLPSLTLLAAGVSVYVGVGVRLVSLIITVGLVARISPVILPERRATVNVCSPSVVASAVGVTVNVPKVEPVPPLTITVPSAVAKSSALVSIVQ